MFQNDSVRDLFYRLQVVNIHLPLLHQRMEDLPDLVQTLLGRINRELGSHVTHLDGGVMEALRAYHWPGNVRELENLLMKATALCSGNRLTVDLLPVELAKLSPPQPEASGRPLSEWSLAEVERAHVARVLYAHGLAQGTRLRGVGRRQAQAAAYDQRLWAGTAGRD